MRAFQPACVVVGSFLVAALPAAEPVPKLGAGDTPLIRAALALDEKAVAAQLAAHANVNAVNAAGGTALLYATASEPIERELLEHGANPNIAAKSGMTPLLSAAFRADSYPVVRLLLDHGADLHAKGAGSESALMFAVAGGDKRTIRLLLDRGAPPGSTGKMTMTPLAMAAFVGDLPTLNLLLDRGANPNDNADFAGHALNYAFYANHPDAAEILIRRGSDLKFPSPLGHGTPPVVFAAYEETGDARIERLLVQRGDSVAAMNDEGATALAFALRTQPHSDLVAYLRSVGAPEPADVGGLRRESLRAVGPADLSDAALRPRIARAVAVLQVSSDAFLQRGFVQHEAKCISCHQQDLPAVATRLASEHGVAVDYASLGKTFSALQTMWIPAAEAARELQFDPIPDSPLNLGYGGMALAAWRKAPDNVTDAMARFLIRAQRADGSWLSYDHRPPVEDGLVPAAALAARFVSVYAPAEDKAAAAACVERARKYLAAAHPGTLNERAFQLLGLGFAGESARHRARLAREICRSQLPDGGWEQLPGRGSDAYATGLTMVALYRAGGMTTADPVYRRAAAYLVSTQGDDGVWWVRSRTWPFQPHFDAKFPHGKDQWISAAGTSWAVIALSFLLDKPPTPAALPDVDTLVARAAVLEPAPPAKRGPQLTANHDPHLFSQEIQPVLKRSCYGCHGGEKHRGDFSLNTRDAILKGGQSGDPAVVVGDSASSQLIDYVSDQVEDLEMPPLERRSKYPALTPEEIARLRAWIDAGLPWDGSG